MYFVVPNNFVCILFRCYQNIIYIPVPNALLFYFCGVLFHKVDLPYDVESYTVKLQDVLNAYLEVETGIEVVFHIL